MRYYHGLPRRGAWFEGAYFKHRGPDGGLALIPAIHRGRAGECTASLQVITDAASYVLEYPASTFSAQRDRLLFQVGQSRFSPEGIRLQVLGEGIDICGTLEYGPLTPLRSDIMGPFRLVEPVMQCYHSVFSLGHSLMGSLTVNGRSMEFSGGRGYIEGDRGCSFPRDYLWTQCSWGESSIMLSVAEIPFLGMRFKGCICTILYRSEELRLATYQGVKVLAYGPRGAEIRQGRYRLLVELLHQTACPLRAPSQGDMVRTVHESLAARVRYRLWRDERLVMDHIDDGASYEYADERGQGVDK